ncbi:hypothetical protein ASPZODRAFT_2115364 [Penicilliopsis zonata CBS 506.65]|uniref:Uncharacterized protein n=1 Tax=Penicilliopsis zonata CBS 506.65 TaxID=1073090 RepID=A0A1L9SRD6_9EURO|nr:hypothetical protein ASPZODRAFT_2115364 [Penicilliopsis zonata CBS 506.65]OJJ49677.1 hypothetical protein ASPZODRAFT_2115364 [Penicilliopsis zonata CBS 506.65]
MQFWTPWQLWQKMTFVNLSPRHHPVSLTIKVIVFAYSFCVLAHNKRKIRRYAAAEAAQREQEELEGISHRPKDNDIPFGARALEKGIQVEGIWVSNHNTPAPSPYQPGTPQESQPLTPYDPGALEAQSGSSQSVVEKPAIAALNRRGVLNQQRTRLRQLDQVDQISTDARLNRNEIDYSPGTNTITRCQTNMEGSSRQGLAEPADYFGYRPHTMS